MRKTIKLILPFTLFLFIALNLVGQTSYTVTSGASPMLRIDGQDYQGYCVEYSNSAPNSGQNYVWDTTHEDVNNLSVRSCPQGLADYGVSAVQQAIWYFTDGINPSSSSSAWDVIDRVNDGTYGPLCATEWYPTNNSYQDMMTCDDVYCVPPPGEMFEYACEDGVEVDIFGASENNNSATVNIPTDNVFKTVVEVVYKGCDPGNMVTVSLNGTNFEFPEVTLTGGSSNVHVYRRVFNYAVSIASTNEACSGLQSIIAITFANTGTDSGVSGVYTALSGYCDEQNFTIPIPTGTSERNVIVKVPVSEFTNDGRHMQITATAGSASIVETYNNPNIGCCLAIFELVIPNVPASATSVDININTKANTDNMSPQNCGQ